MDFTDFLMIYAMGNIVVSIASSIYDFKTLEKKEALEELILSLFGLGFDLVVGTIIYFLVMVV